MKLGELVLEVVEHDIPPMSTRTFTEVIAILMNDYLIGIPLVPLWHVSISVLSCPNNCPSSKCG
jgi:hypothetical protein